MKLSIKLIGGFVSVAEVEYFNNVSAMSFFRKATFFVMKLSYIWTSKGNGVSFYTVKKLKGYFRF